MEAAQRADDPCPGCPAARGTQGLGPQPLEQVRENIEGDLDEMSWNLIAQIEAGDHVLDALDLMLSRDLDKIVAAHRPTRWTWRPCGASCAACRKCGI